MGLLKPFPEPKIEFLKTLAFMTQNNPKDVGLMGGNPTNELQDVAVGF